MTHFFASFITTTIVFRQTYMSAEKWTCQHQFSENSSMRYDRFMVAHSQIICTINENDVFDCSLAGRAVGILRITEHPMDSIHYCPKMNTRTCRVLQFRLFMQSKQEPELVFDWLIRKCVSHLGISNE